MTVRVSAHQPGRDLGAVDRPGHNAKPLLQHGDIEAGVVKNLGLGRIGKQRSEIGCRAIVERDLHDIGAAIAGRELHDAEPVAMRIEPHGLGIDRHLAAGIVAEVRQVAAMQSDGHG